LSALDFRRRSSALVLSAAGDRLRASTRRTAGAAPPATSSEPAQSGAGGETVRPGHRGALLVAELLALEAALKRARAKHRLQTERPAEARLLLAAATASSERAYQALCTAAAGLEGPQGLAGGREHPRWAAAPAPAMALGGSAGR
jgi:hypothetical protein